MKVFSTFSQILLNHETFLSLNFYCLWYIAKPITFFDIAIMPTWYKIRHKFAHEHNTEHNGLAF